jgi:hypothetical protein
MVENTTIDLCKSLSKNHKSRLNKIAKKRPYKCISNSRLKIGAFVEAAKNSSRPYKCISKGRLGLLRFRFSSSALPNTSSSRDSAPRKMWS